MENLKEKLAARFERFGLTNPTVTLFAAVDYPKRGQHVKLIPITPEPLGLIEAITSLEKLYTEANCEPGSPYKGEPIPGIMPQMQTHMKVAWRFVVKSGEKEIGFIDTHKAFFFTKASTLEKMYLYLMVTLGASLGQADWTMDFYPRWAKGFALCMQCIPWSLEKNDEIPKEKNPIFVYQHQIWLRVITHHFESLKLPYGQMENTYRTELWETGTRLMGHPHTCFPFIG